MIFNIEEYSGPLDLVLDIFKKNKLEITEHNIVYVIDQYVEIVNKLNSDSYTVAVEYLDMIAELVYYKSAKVLHEEIEVEDEIVEISDLLQRIVEYKRYKEATKEIKYSVEKRNNSYIKEQSNLGEYINDKLDNIGLERFKVVANQVFFKITNNTDNRDMRELDLDTEINIYDYVKKLEKMKNFNFLELSNNKKLKEKIAIFLAILELVKRDDISYKITDENIYIKVG